MYDFFNIDSAKLFFNRYVNENNQIIGNIVLFS